MVQTQPPIQLPVDLPVDIPKGAKVTSKVRITAPRQTNGERISYTLEALPSSPLPDPTGFNPGRTVMNIRLSKNGAIAPKVKLEIELTYEEAQHATKGDLKVAYHDKKQWYELGWEINKGFVVVEFDKVGDPPIGISP